MRPPQLRCVFFSSMYLPHLLVLPATFWTSVPFATLSVFPSLICGSCPSGQRFAYSFFQIPSHGGHPCCSAMCFVVAYAHLGLSPIRKRPCWANKTGASPQRKTLLPVYQITNIIMKAVCRCKPGYRRLRTESVRLRNRKPQMPGILLVRLNRKPRPNGLPESWKR